MDIRSSDIDTSSSGPRLWGRRHSFFKMKLKLGREINEQLLDKNAVKGVVVLMEKAGKAEIWNMMMQCYGAGFLRNSKYSWNHRKDPCTLRFLFPHTPGAFAKTIKMTSERDRRFVRNTIIPAALAKRDELLDDPSKLEKIVRQFIIDSGAEPLDALAEAPALAPASAPKRFKVETIKSELNDFTGSYEEWMKLIDPEFTGTPMEFVAKYGHVQKHTAIQYASIRFSDWAGYMKSLAKFARGMPTLPERGVDHNKLRNPEPNDVAKLADALEYLRPKIAEAELLLATATEALKKKGEEVSLPEQAASSYP
jgi:hypothetical protein